MAMFNGSVKTPDVLKWRPNPFLHYSANQNDLLRVFYVYTRSLVFSRDYVAIIFDECVV
jgi:hypothetical protein